MTTIPAVRSAFSLVEMLVVLSIVSLLLAVAAPSFVSMNPSRKAGIHEVAGFLEGARAKAVASRSEMAVSFADASFPVQGGALRSYALFAKEEDESGRPSLRRLSPWRTLPEGLVFASGVHFDAVSDAAFRTLHDVSGTLPFPVPGSAGGDSPQLPLPCVVFGPDGSVRSPAFFDADALHVGLIEGFHDPAGGTVVVASAGKSRGECLSIGHCTGRVRILTD